jgi:hypothetical protein
MTAHNHAIVWVDHRIAKAFFLGLDAVDQQTVHADLPTEHLHHKANTIGSGKAHADPSFFPRINDLLQHSKEILVVGPGNEKTLLLKFLGEGQHSLRGREVRAVACEHPTDREIIALGRRHFHLGEPTR